MKNQIVCLALSPWQSGIPARTEQLLSRLASKGQALYFEPPYKGGSPKGRKVRPNVTAYTLPAPTPITGLHASLFRVWQQRARRFIARVMAEQHITAPLFWLSSPEWYPLVEEIPRRGLVYDCARLFPNLSEAWEIDLTYAADICFAACPSLADHLAPCNDNVVHLANGCNFPVFAGITPHTRRKKPTLLYCGTLWDDLDLSPIAALASAHPEWRIRLAGAVLPNDPRPYELAALPNVEVLGSYEARDMASLLEECDVCLNLLRKDQPLTDLIPNRIYEYLASGKPIVSMLYPGQIEVFADTIYGAHTLREWVTCCEKALMEVGDTLPARRRRHGQQANWSARAEQVANMLSDIGLFDQ